MSLKYKDEEFEDKIFKEFYDDTAGEWSQMEQPTIRDFIKWVIIKGYLIDSSLGNIRATLGSGVIAVLDSAKSEENITYTCPECGRPLVKNEDIVLATMPPSYEYRCSNCTYIEYHNK